MSKKKDSLKPWLSRPTVNRSVTLPLTRPLTQRLSNLNEFHPNELDPYLLFDAQDSMIGTLENPTLDLDPSKPDTLNVITATRAGVATFTDVNGLIASAPANTVRVDHVDSVPMILVEPSATNLVTYSEDFGNSLYTKRNSTVTSGFSSPDGENNAFKLTATANEGDVYFVLGGGGGTTKAVSVFAKAASETSELIIQELGYTGRSTKFNLNSGAITSSNSAGTSTIENFGNGWFRCTHIETYSSGQNTLAYAYRSTTVDSLYLFGAQVETGSVATSLIPTSGGDAAARTRAADNLVISGSAFSSFYNQSEGTFYLEFEPRELSTSITNTALELSNGTGAERILSHVDSQIHAYFVDGGNVQANIDGGTNTVGVINRLAISYKANNIQVSVSGGAVVSDTSASIPTVDRLIIGNQVDDNTRLLNGHIKRLIYWPYHSDIL